MDAKSASSQLQDASGASKTVDDAAVFGASPVATFASQRPTAEHEAVATPSDAAEPDARSAPVVQDDARINIATEARDEKPSGPAEEVEMEKLSGDSNVPFGSSLPGTKAVAAIFGASPVAIANERQTTELEVAAVPQIDSTANRTRVARHGDALVLLPL